MPTSLSSLSTEYIRVAVSATDAGNPVNPTGDAVSFAFMTDSTTEPDGLDWQTGSWETAGSVYLARILIGPAAGGYSLVDGKYYVWVKIDGTPEKPVRQVGVLTIT